MTPAYFTFDARGTRWVERVEVPAPPPQYGFTPVTWRAAWLALWRTDRVTGGCHAVRPVTERAAVREVAAGFTPFKWSGTP